MVRELCKWKDCKGEYFGKYGFVTFGVSLVLLGYLANLPLETALIFSLSILKALLHTHFFNDHFFNDIIFLMIIEKMTSIYTLIVSIISRHFFNDH